jgi:hypothetical protein
VGWIDADIMNEPQASPSILTKIKNYRRRWRIHVKMNEERSRKKLVETSDSSFNASWRVANRSIDLRFSGSDDNEKKR